MNTLSIDPNRSIEENIIIALVAMAQDGQEAKSCCIRIDRYAELQQELGDRKRYVEMNGVRGIEIDGPQGPFVVFGLNGVPGNKIVLSLESDEDASKKLQARVSDMKKHLKALEQKRGLMLFSAWEAERYEKLRFKDANEADAHPLNRRLVLEQAIQDDINALSDAIDELERPLVEKSVAKLLERTKELLS